MPALQGFVVPVSAVTRVHPLVFFFTVYFTPAIELKSESCVHRTALYIRAVAKIMLSAIGRLSLRLMRAALRESDALKSTTLPCCIKATAFSASVSSRCCKTRLKTSYKLTLGTTSSVLNRGSEKGYVRPVCKIFQPPRRIDNIHTRSFSRIIVVSMPFRNPRICFSGRKGISSMRPSYMIA